MLNRVETINGTAVSGEDYISFNETIKFAKNETLKSVHIEIVDDFEWEPDEFFFVKLHLDPNELASLGQHSHFVRSQLSTMTVS